MSTMEVTTITIEQTIASNADTFFLIDCLGEGDKQSARIRHEGIRDTLMAQSAQNIFHDTSRIYHERCKSREGWARTINKIQESCQQGMLPLVFIDGHGDAEKGLALPGGGFIGWQEYGESLRAITDAAHGELTVVAGFCHSFAFVKTVERARGTLPFAFYYGYKDEVRTSDVENETRLIYESLIEDGGQSLRQGALQISRYDEFEHALETVVPVIMMDCAPETLRSELPEFSKRRFRGAFEKDIATMGRPLGETRKLFNQLLSNTPLIAQRLIEARMHDTDRRSRFIERIHSEIEQARELRRAASEESLRMKSV
jgi:hypothetical protein